MLKDEWPGCQGGAAVVCICEQTTQVHLTMQCVPGKGQELLMEHVIAMLVACNT